ncbi:hypothetical protein CCP4SC76_6980002 [Gammaproteobacteria bacterium]
MGKFFDVEMLKALKTGSRSCKTFSTIGFTAKPASFRNALVASLPVLYNTFLQEKLYKERAKPMHAINHLPPERMTPAQRRIEIASLLARGLARLRNDPETPVDLAISGHQSLHKDLVNQRKPESK